MSLHIVDIAGWSLRGKESPHLGQGTQSIIVFFFFFAVMFHLETMTRLFGEVMKPSSPMMSHFSPWTFHTWM
jgi:hypothetical protein